MEVSQKLNDTKNIILSNGNVICLPKINSKINRVDTTNIISNLNKLKEKTTKKTTEEKSTEEKSTKEKLSD